MEKGIFGGSRVKRQAALSNFYESNISRFINTPQIGLDAINVILEEIFATQKLPRLHMVLLKINYCFEATPLQRKDRRKVNHEYCVRFFDRLYTISYSRIPEKILVNLNFNVQELIFSWRDDFQENRKKYRLEDLLYCADLTLSRFSKATGMAVKKTTRRGTFQIGGGLVNLSSKHPKEFVLVFFDKSKLYIFDLNGRKIEPISLTKYKKRKKRKKRKRGL